MVRKGVGNWKLTGFEPVADKGCGIGCALNWDIDDIESPIFMPAGLVHLKLRKCAHLRHLAFSIRELGSFC